MGKILSIKQKMPERTVLPDGVYIGTWGGCIIQLEYKGRTFELTTEVEVKGRGYSVVVNIIDGVATFNEVNN